MTYHVVVEPDFWDKLTAIGTVVAFGAVAITLWLSVRAQRDTRAGQRLVEAGQQQEKEIAENTAARAEAAARVSAEYSERIVAALETVARSGIGGAATSAPARAKWELSHQVGDTYRLANVGDATAYSVKITSDETLPLIDVPDGQDLASDEACTFVAAPSMGTRDRTITVTWNADDVASPGGTWRYPLPPRPPRR